MIVSVDVRELMMLNSWIHPAIVIATGVGMAVLCWVTAPRLAEQSLRRLVHRSGLQIRDDLAPTVTRRLRRRGRAMALGMAVGLAIGCIRVTAISDPGNGFAWFYMCLLIGAGVAALAVHALDTARASRELGRRRAAILRPRRLRDFLSPVEMAAPYLGLAVPLLIVGFATASSQNTPVLVGCSATAVAFAALAMTTQRWVLHMAPPVDSSERIAWEDMLRDVALRDCGVTAYALSFALATAQHITRSGVSVTNPDPLYWFTSFLLIVSMCGMLTIALGTDLSNRKTTRFLGRLYPELGAPR